MNKTGKCEICQIFKKASELMPFHAVRHDLFVLAQVKNPLISQDGMICFADLNKLRSLFIRRTLELERGDINTLEDSVLKSMHEHEIVANNIGKLHEGVLTFGDRLADKIASFGGSWKFILSFAGVITIWIAFNSMQLLNHTFDPFPFILLNLVLSCLAAVQAPLIMMSQNRQESRDRMRADEDYRTNLKAELEIRMMNLKMDQLMTHQWQRLLDIQEIQTDILRETTMRSEKSVTKNPT